MFRLYSSRVSALRRRLWLLAGLLLLAVQIGLPAHQDSHPLGSSDTACHYCMLGGHLPGMPVAAAIPVFAAVHEERPVLWLDAPAIVRPHSVRLTRGPPGSCHA